MIRTSVKMLQTIAHRCCHLRLAAQLIAQNTLL